MVNLSRRTLRLDSGTVLTLTGALKGGRSNYVCGARLGDRFPVVCKVARLPGSHLAAEARMLTALSAASFACPDLVEAGSASINGNRVYCLVLGQLSGTLPQAPDAWQRSGQCLAGLHSLDLRPPGLAIRTPSAWGVPVDPRAVALLGAGRAGLPGEPDALIDRAVRLLTSTGCAQVIAHGDAGPRNFLAAESTTLLDFESACLQPAGADLGRFLFLMRAEGLVPEPACEAAATRFLRGYRDVSRDLPPHLDIWAGLEGLRIAQWRFTRRDQPATPPWRPALETALRQLALGVELAGSRR